ncbi:gamma-glutamyl-gamma-aminobutyrate hydrolase family protein [Desulfopila sp. IMCC35006]|uniref:gamma-glutamyl-gamma-aminobutyrate hydrolase family protein n=1 Tax=Desulfopila sp. IMCC35006 TaxID=2569542 RepID=UPI0010AD8B8F|nr:gamma-glutamyl-gamma-aminobutyrate hydrolase family protein [Desulfopila sp. IMCC35006]TKB26205.1 gamma-glutamyl-gamma-aminobutyrate hydrolase family protein [Desulfopila sp. IMCC35006]
MKPFIAIVCYTDENQHGIPSHILPIAYTTAIEAAGGIPYIIPFTRQIEQLSAMLQIAHGVLLTGGIDIAPQHYGEKKRDRCGRTNCELDAYQFAAFRIARESKKPVLAICRGAQLVNVALGGTLYQDIFSELSTPLHCHSGGECIPGVDHKVFIEPESKLHHLFGSTITVNSRHHQAIKTPGKDLLITALASDGIIEAAEHRELPITLVQWHPELMMSVTEKTMLPLFKTLIKCSS